MLAAFPEFPPRHLRDYGPLGNFQTRAELLSLVTSFATNGGMKFVVGALQFDIAWENKEANFATVRKLLQQANPPKNALIALPEMFATGFSMNVDAVVEPYGGKTEHFLAETAKHFGIYLIGGAPMRGKAEKPCNKALVFSPEGKLIAWYAKMRPFTPGGEKDYYAAGSKPATFRWGECTVSPFVC